MRAPAGLAGGLVLVLSLRADARGPAFHKRFDPDPEEDLALGATVAGGNLPAVMQTRSGLVQAPDGVAESLRQGDVYGGPQTPTSVDATFRLDRLTSRPDRVHYDAPFRPSVIPFKRLYAYDWVQPSLHLGVKQEQLVPIPVGGSVGEHEDAFFADFEVDLQATRPGRIPSVAPMARLRALQVEPPGAVEILRDSAENWFARSPRPGRIRLVLQLSVDRRVFGDIYPPISWERLAPYRPDVPPEARRAAQQVLEHIGVANADSPAHALRILVDYFRRFRDSDELPRAVTPRDLYLELSLGQKGVCRHRAYAFLVTAQSLGIPTRLVHNEAHAWVEVFDAERWLRVDLGGAAARVDVPSDEPRRMTHRPPPDPFSWPSGGQPGHLLSQRSSGQALGPGVPGTPSSSREVDPGGPAAAPPATPPTGGRGGRPPDGDTAPDGPGPFGGRGLRELFSLDPARASAPAVTISLSVRESEVKRGAPLTVSGRATRAGRACALARLDLFLNEQGAVRVIGSVATDRQGYYLGQVTIPRDSSVGDQKLGIRLGAGCP